MCVCVCMCACVCSCACVLKSTRKTKRKDRVCVCVCVCVCVEEHKSLTRLPSARALISPAAPPHTSLARVQELPYYPTTGVT